MPQDANRPPLIIWSEKMETGIRIIDADHRMLVDITNSLAEAINDQQASERVGKILDSLIQYCEQHFEREERFMAEAGYPDFEKHLRLHHELTEKAHAVRRFHRRYPDKLNAPEIVQFLKAWLSDHILKSDMAYVPYLTGHKKGTNMHPNSAAQRITLRVKEQDSAVLFACASILLEGGEEAETLRKEVYKLHKVSPY